MCIVSLGGDKQKRFSGVILLTEPHLATINESMARSATAFAVARLGLVEVVVRKTAPSSAADGGRTAKDDKRQAPTQNHAGHVRRSRHDLRREAIRFAAYVFGG